MLDIPKYVYRQAKLSKATPNDTFIWKNSNTLQWVAGNWHWPCVIVSGVLSLPWLTSLASGGEFMFVSLYMHGEPCKSLCVFVFAVGGETILFLNFL